MALKIVGRTPTLVRERSQGPSQARHATMRCSACGKFAFVNFPWNVTQLRRQQMMKAALDEHRKVCTVGNAEERRDYTILYPRG